jgi:hypothetical protein
MKFSRSLLVLVLFVVGCSSTTVIDTVPNGAKLYMNGMYKGITPYTYSDTKILGSTTQLKFEKEGFEPLVAVLKRDEKADVGAIIGGIFFLFPFLWTMEYDPMHTFELRQGGATTPTQSKEIQLSGAKAEKLRELKKLFYEGLITAEDFERQKQKILDEQ